jgi:anti-sigma-K factor RskA
LLREYRSFLAVFEQLDQAPVPELSAHQKAEIFHRSWQGRRRDWSWTWTWLGLFRRPAVTFAIGIVLGCVVMFLAMDSRASRTEPEVVGPLAAAEPSLTVERIQHTQVYKGKAVEQLYPGIENPRIVIEKTRESSTPQRVLYGTLDDGEIYVVWNL